MSSDIWDVADPKLDVEILGSGIRYIQGGPKKVSQIIFAITLSTASQFP